MQDIRMYQRWGTNPAFANAEMDPEKIARWCDVLLRLDTLMSIASKAELQAVLRWCESVYRDLGDTDTRRDNHREIARLLRRQIKCY